MRTVVPDKLSDLFAFAAEAARGCRALEAVIGLAHNLEASVGRDLEAAREAASQFEAAKAARLTALRRQSEALRGSTAWLYAARDYLKQFLGRSYSLAWSKAGFTSNSLAVPVSPEGRLERLKSLELYFSAHPDHEWTPLAITHGAATAWYAELSAAVTALNWAKTLQRTRRQARDAAVNSLRARMRGLIAELRQVLGPSDARWLDFGFNVPTDKADEKPGKAERDGTELQLQEQ